MTALRQRLRGLASLVGHPPPFDPDARPAEPGELFDAWLQGAIDAGVAEPHAMVLSTVDAHGSPDSRVLILKDLTDEGWWFAGDANSAKGEQLAANPAASLLFYWTSIGRSVRIRGTVQRGAPERARADFLARGEGARAVALMRRDSSPGPQDGIDREFRAARDRLAEDPSAVPDAWSVWCLRAASVEFWQADAERRHLRVRYERAGDEWSSTRLWP
jgi:pyridoxamine 5'-phosphate oxidase